jgi:hypothetical protein
MDDEWREAWGAALDELELTIEMTERLLGGDVPDDLDVPEWTPPAIDGPIPSELAFRARTLLGRQQSLITETVTATVGVRRKLELLDKLTGTSKGARTEPSVYVDLTA